MKKNRTMRIMYVVVAFVMLLSMAFSATAGFVDVKTIIKDNIAIKGDVSITNKSNNTTNSNNTINSNNNVLSGNTVIVNSGNTTTTNTTNNITDNSTTNTTTNNTAVVGNNGDTTVVIANDQSGNSNSQKGDKKVDIDVNSNNNTNSNNDINSHNNVNSNNEVNVNSKNNTINDSYNKTVNDSYNKSNTTNNYNSYNTYSSNNNYSSSGSNSSQSTTPVIIENNYWSSNITIAPSSSSKVSKTREKEKETKKPFRVDNKGVFGIKTKSKCNIYEKANTSSKLVMEVNEDSPLITIGGAVVIKGCDENWRRVYVNGIVGYVEESNLYHSSQDKATFVLATAYEDAIFGNATSKVYVYNSTGSKRKIIGTVTKDTVQIVLAEKGDNLAIVCGEKIGYVSKSKFEKVEFLDDDWF